MAHASSRDRPISALSPTRRATTTTTTTGLQWEERLFGGDDRQHFQGREDNEININESDAGESEDKEEENSIIILSNNNDNDTMTDGSHACRGTPNEQESTGHSNNSISYGDENGEEGHKALDDPQRGDTPTLSRLTEIANILTSHPMYNLGDDIAWQRGIGAVAARAKQFRVEVTQELKIVAFAVMRPGSPFIHVLHSIATYTARGGIG